MFVVIRTPVKIIKNRNKLLIDKRNICDEHLSFYGFVKKNVRNSTRLFLTRPIKGSYLRLKLGRLK